MVDTLILIVMSIRKAKKLFKKYRFTGCGESGLKVQKRDVKSPWDNGHWSDFYYKSFTI